MLTAMSTPPLSIARSWSARADATVAATGPKTRAGLQAFEAWMEHFELALYAEP